MRKILALLAVLVSLMGCSPRVVEVERPVVVEQTHTQVRTDIVRDTLVWRDSVYHYVQGDTVVIEKWHHVRDVSRVVVADTVRDTIPRVVTVTQTVTQEVEKPLPWWLKGLAWVGGLTILSGGIWAASRKKR